MADHGDFAEEEVWEGWKLGGTPTAKNGSPKSRRDKGTSSSSSSSSSSSRRPSARSNPNPVDHGSRQSAPLSIPDWSRVYQRRRSSHGKSFAGSDGGAAAGGNEEEEEEEEEEEDGEEGERVVPPHEWLARKMSRSQISSFSVCEGAGRTLKGRDLRKVRNAVLTKTGFLE